jgi:hypothetical protein
MRRLVLPILVLLTVGPGTATAGLLQVDSALADLDDGRVVVEVFFTGKVPEELRGPVSNPASFRVLAPVPAGDETVPPTVAGAELAVEDVRLSPEGDSVLIRLGESSYGTGKVELVAPLAAGDHRIEPPDHDVTWTVAEPYATSWDAHFTQALALRGQTPSLDLDGAYSTLRWPKPGKKPRRLSLQLQGTLPLGTPDDVEETAGADDDASEEVADYLQGSALATWYTGSTLLSAGLVSRATGSLEGVEVVLTGQAARLLFDNRVFLGAQLESGWREGDAEWENLTEKAPDRGNTVARVGAVGEWAPKIGPINLDLGSGLRFFVRGRGWADYFEDADRSDDVRFRGFLDAELFWNVSDDFRVFLRHEEGYLPPDLSERHSETFVGVGSAF